MNPFDLTTLLNPQNLAPKPEAFSPDDIGALQEQSASRRNSTIEVLRPETGEDPTGGQSIQNRLIGQYSCWLQEVGQTVEGAIGTTAKYFIGVAHDADVSFRDRLASPGWLNAWRENQTYGEGALIVPASQSGNGHYYECVKAGQSALDEPNWNTQIGFLVIDGAAIWKCVGEIHYFEVTGDDAAKSTPAEKIIVAEETR